MLGALILWMAAASAPADRVALRLDTSEADAVLAIVETRAAGDSTSAGDWDTLFATEPYRRLKAREAEMNRAFTDEWFADFVRSDSLAARAADLRRTLDAWRGRDLAAAARRVLAYLPGGARIHASVYPVIKPQTNTFVYDLRGDPAIFYYVDPGEPAATFENTVAHELHHVGFASMPDVTDSVLAGVPASVRTAVEWMGAFGEGFAMLAAAGDADTHPHATSAPETRARWDRDIAAFDENLRALDTFFLDVVDGTLATPDEIRSRAFSFFGVQGPWYTVGYRMASLVERHFGRDVLIACMVDPRELLARYERVAAAAHTRGEPMARWSPRLLDAIGIAADRRGPE